MVDDVFFFSLLYENLTHFQLHRLGPPHLSNAEPTYAIASGLLSWALHRLGPPHLSNAAENGSGFRIVG